MNQNVSVSKEVLDDLLPGNDVLELECPHVAGGASLEFVKRVFDIIVASFALILLAIPMAVVGAIVRLESNGPILYAQTRVGKNGKLFKLYKFRSMVSDAEEDGIRWASDDDDRITSFGKVLRKTRLDEVPQFFNILKGEMSLVGPRPERPVFCDAFEDRIHGWHYRTLVTPGLTGLAQVEGGYDLLPKEKVVLDLKYIESRSAILDLTIILKTFGIITTGKGAR